MSKIDTIAGEAFANGRKLAKQNTQVLIGDDGERAMFLHGNEVACYRPGVGLMISLAGWPTVTTRARLNGVLAAMGSDYRVTQSANRQYVRNVLTGDLSPITVDEWHRIPDGEG